jgi:hypothetical protein
VELYFQDLLQGSYLGQAPQVFPELRVWFLASDLSV